MATIGNTAAPSTNTIYYDSLLSTTMAAFRDTMVDNIFKDSAFLAFLRQSDAVVKQNGGERIAMPLMIGTNSTVKSYAGEQVIDTTLQDGITTAFYDWREIAGTVGITRKEERQNSGDGRILALLEAKLKQAQMSMREELNRQLLAGIVSSATLVPGNNGLDLNPLGWFLRIANRTNPVSGGNVGNLSAATEAYWRNQTATLSSGSLDTGNAFALNVTTYAGLEAALRRMHNACSKGSGGSPNLVVMDQITFESYENSQNVKVRYTDQKMADLGFDTVKLRGATCIWDEVVPDMGTGVLYNSSSFAKGTAFFLNTNFYNLIIDSETDIVTTPFVEPENQTVKTAKILFMGNAAVNNLRKHGVIYNISQSIVA